MDDLEDGLPSRAETAVENHRKNVVEREDLHDSETFESYLLQILWKPIQFYHLLAGSFFELPGHYVLANLTDTDRMRIYPNFQAIPPDAKPPDNSERQFLFIDTQTSPVGFCRLQYPNQNRFYDKSRTGLHGPAYTVLLSDWLDVGCKISDLAPKPQEFRKLTLDEVDAFYCPYWPSEGTDWITRTSVSGWPDKNIKDHIVRGGCHLVAKSHHTKPNDSTQWRYSFSQAEVILINSWNGVQKYIYHILRVIKKDISKKCSTPEKSVFNNYFFKTLMLWASEKKTVEFWNEECTESSIAELLCQAIECLIDRECQHYFIPKVNILDHSLEFDTVKEISSLEENLRYEIQGIMCRFPKCDKRSHFQVELSKNLIVHYKLRANAEFVINPFSLSFERYFDNELENDPLFRTELETLFKGLLANLGLRSSKSLMLRMDHEKTVNECFRSCLEENSYNPFGAIIHSNESFHMIANRLFNVDRSLAHALSYSSTLSPKSANAASPKDAIEKLQISEIDTNVSAICNEKSCISSRIVKPKTLRERTCCYVRTPPKDWECYSANANHRSPNFFLNLLLTKISDLYKKPCYLISRAYYANYYYTYHKNYQVAMNLCKETLVYIENSPNCTKLQTRMHEEIFPVILNSYWMPLFDENIQLVFALLILTIVVKYSEGIPLTSFSWIPPSFKKVPMSYSVTLDSVIRASPSGLGTVQRRKRFQQAKLISSVFVQISAVEFIRYIGVQCRKQLSLDEDSLFDMRARQPSVRRLVTQSLLLLASASFKISNPKL